MTEIKAHTPPPPASQAKIESAGAQRGSLTHGHAQRNLRDQSTQNDNGPERSKSSVFVSQTAFEARIEALQDDTQPFKRDEDKQESAEHVLVSPDQGRTATLDPVPVKESATPERMAKAEALANVVATRVDHALKTGPALPVGQVSMTLPLDAQTGLSGVQVTLSDGVLSVVLLRGSDAVHPHLALAALNLETILQSRFPARQIRISEKAADGKTEVSAAEVDQAPAGFAHLFLPERGTAT